MDLTTAKIHKRRLQRELEAYIPHAPAPSYVALLIDKEVNRLNKELASGVLRSLAGDSEVKIAVENETLLQKLAEYFLLILTDVPSLEDFQAHLVSELPRVKNFDKQLPLTYQFTRRVIEILEEEICKQKRRQNRRGEGSSPSGSPSACSKALNEELSKSIEDAINTVVERNQEGASSDQVLDILKENSSFVIDDYVRRAVRQKFFEATFVLDRKPAPEESVHCCSFLSLINALSRRFI